ncbi:MAG: glycosyltransferase family 2 protein [Planctomycetes bacterium]|nr:glycosyltransferase family 2 protein [Planctomycetota bacterium]
MNPADRAPADPFARITAVVVNYNGAEHLPPCLEGLALQGPRIDRVLVVDNASTDGSPALVAQRFPAATVIELGENRGPCPARNAGLRAASTEWVLLVDNDAVLTEGVLEKLIVAARSRPDVALVQPRSVFATEATRVHYDGGELHYVGLFALRNFYVPLAEARGVGTLEVGGAVSVALLVRRELVLALGGFDERYFILFEDLDLSFRLRAAGHAILSVEDALVLHRGGTPGISFRKAASYPRSRAFFHSRNRWYFLDANYRRRTLALAAPGLLLYELVWLAFCLKDRTLGGWLEGKVAFLKDGAGRRAARERTRAVRRVGDRELLVGGPLTIAPQLSRRGFAAAVLQFLDGALALWWKLVRPWIG